MSDDLTHYMEAVSRLRAEVETLKKANAMLLAGFGPVALEAADLEIDRLRARVSQLEGEARARESAYDTLSRLQVNTRADLSAALAHAAGWQEHAQRGWTERDALKARVAELEAALRSLHGEVCGCESFENPDVLCPARRALASPSSEPAPRAATECGVCSGSGLNEPEDAGQCPACGGTGKGAV